MLEENVLNILNTVDPTLFVVFVKITIVILIVRMVYKLIGTTTDYILFRTDKYIAYGSKVVVDDEEWWIKRANIFWIHLENDSGYKQISPTRWRHNQPKILKRK